MSVEKLLDIMAALRDPQSGCPWDLQQTFATIAPYTIEEAYEVSEAIAQQDYQELCNELGDLLLQVVFHSQLAKEAGHFEFSDVVASINDKMLRRHPHVFAKNSEESSDPEEIMQQQQPESKKIAEIKRLWEQEKARERADKNIKGVVDGIAASLPALTRAQKLQKRAAQVGFDWQSIDGVFDKVKEELGELRQAMQCGNSANLLEESGDLLFSCVNLARWLKVDAETGLQEANRKFEKRVKWIETRLEKLGKAWHDCSPSELDGFWNEAKQAMSEHK